MSPVAESPAAPPQALSQQDFLRELATVWQGRRSAQGLRPGTKGHGDAALEFFIGAFSAAAALGHHYNEMALVVLSVGRDPVEEWAGNINQQRKTK